MRLSIVAALALVSTSAFAQVKTPDMIAQFDCPAGQTCSVKCSGAGGTLDLNYTFLAVYQYTVHPTRLWFLTDTKRYVVGVDQTCSFEGVAQGSFIPAAQLNSPVQPNRPTVGGTPVNPGR
jgi:hypothetical protein